MKAVWTGIVDRTIFVVFFTAMAIIAVISPRKAFEIIEGFMDPQSIDPQSLDL